jgi:hypothetical protein
MRDSVHISEPMADLFERGALPERIEMLEKFGPFRPGDVLTWSNADRCYLDTAGRWCLWALNVRQMWGLGVIPAKQTAIQQPLFAA